jgi:hypothetical protein
VIDDINRLNFVEGVGLTESRQFRESKKRTLAVLPKHSRNYDRDCKLEKQIEDETVNRHSNTDLRAGHEPMRVLVAREGCHSQALR